MKTATITWITYNNYGTHLQAYALQQYLLKSGYINTIFSDKLIVEKKFLARKKEKENTVKQKDNHKKGKVFYKYYKKVRKTIYKIIKPFIISYYKIKRRIHLSRIRPYLDSLTRYDHFRNTKLDITYFDSIQDIYKQVEQYDLFVCGSDQIWSVFEETFDSFYYLDFIKKKKKISYAPSIGAPIVPLSKREVIISLLEDFQAISVREKNAADQLSNITRKKVCWVLDPVLLHGEEFWGSLCKEINIKTKHNKYLLCYFLSNNKWYFSYAKSMAKFLKLRLLFIPVTEQVCRNKYTYKKGVGPIEFVSLIKNATYVLTDSYHASIFSIIFKRDFLCLKRFNDDDVSNQNSRILSLFDALGLHEKFIEEKRFVQTDLQRIEYQRVFDSLERLRQKSISFLKENIQ